VLAALDTNLLVYAEGVALLPADALKPARVRALLAALPSDDIGLPVQVLAELFRVLVGKAGWSRPTARRAIMAWRDLYPTIDTTAAVAMAAMDLCVDHQLSIWDAVVLAAAAEAGCRIILSEDMQDGFVWRGLTVVNPLSEVRHPLLASLLAGESNT
jgi:predicted nucleic acid-binding protein